MARALRALLALDILALAAAAWALRHGGASWPVAVGAPLLALLVLDLALVGAAWALSRRYACAIPEDSAVSRVATICAFFAEFLATEALGRLSMPFDRLVMGPDRRGAGARRGPPVLLIHGYLCNRGFWWWMRGKLEEAGHTVATVTLEPVFGDIDAYAEGVRERIDQLIAETGAARVVVVGHSMGGLACRAYLRRFGAERVARLITLGTPHGGTRLARLGRGLNAGQMRHASDWLGALGAAACPVPVTAVWSTHDTIVAPQDNGRLRGAREIVLGGLGHMAMAFSPRILAILLDELDREAQTPPAPARGA